MKMRWPFGHQDLDILIDTSTITAAPADTPITTPAAFLPQPRDFSGVTRPTSEAVQPSDRLAQESNLRIPMAQRPAST